MRSASDRGVFISACHSSIALGTQTTTKKKKKKEEGIDSLHVA